MSTLCHAPTHGTTSVWNMLACCQHFIWRSTYQTYHPVPNVDNDINRHINGCEDTDRQTQTDIQTDGHKHNTYVTSNSISENKSTNIAAWHGCQTAQRLHCSPGSLLINTDHLTPTATTLALCNYTINVNLHLSLIHIWRCRRIERCRSRWSPYH